MLFQQEVTNLANIAHMLQALTSDSSQNVFSLRSSLIEEASNFSVGVCNAAVTGRICYWLSSSCKIFPIEFLSEDFLSAEDQTVYRMRCYCPAALLVLVSLSKVKDEMQMWKKSAGDIKH